jgi:ribonuclease HII
MNDLYKYENELYSQNIEYIAGIDEVGRGPLVGAVVASCVILPRGFILEGLTDSKKLSPKKRDLFYDIIMEQAIGVGIGIIDNKKIDEVNIYQATKLAMIEAITNTHCKIEHVLIDAMKLDIDIPSTSIIKGDSKSISIAAASVIAKVTRDRIMIELDKIHPEYGFKDHKGYPTKKHIKALNKYGILDEHRRSFYPVSILSNEKKDEHNF